MLGYIAPDKPELKIKEYELYSGYYCGICKSIGKRYGQLPRMTLSYDSVFLALIVSGLQSETETFKIQRCPVHPLKKRLILYDNKAVDYAADMQLMLSYYKLKDDYVDEGNLFAGTAAFLSRGIMGKLTAKHSETAAVINMQLGQLSEIERRKTASLDESAEPFAKIMERVFRCKDGSFDFKADDKHLILARIGYHIGKWIYLIDAYDDMEKNIRDKAYNPILIQFDFKPNGDETISDFKERVKPRIEYNLMSYLEELSKAYDLLPIAKNKGLIENIIYFGLLRKTEEVLAKRSNKQDGESI